MYDRLIRAINELNECQTDTTELNNRLSEIDLKLQYWLHYLENKEGHVDTKESYRIVREMRNLRIERRSIKNDLCMLQSFATSVGKLNNIQNRNMLINQLSSLKHKQENMQEYNPDVYTHEEIEKILN